MISIEFQIDLFIFLTCFNKSQWLYINSLLVILEWRKKCWNSLFACFSTCMVCWWLQQICVHLDFTSGHFSTTIISVTLSLQWSLKMIHDWLQTHWAQNKKGLKYKITDLPWTGCTITKILSLTIEKRNKTNCFGPLSSSSFPVVWSCYSCEWELKMYKTPFPLIGLNFKWQEVLQMNIWIIYMLYKP